jgi:hypothetical protein
VGAPYAISCPGTVVSIISYQETGMIRVVVLAREKTTQAIEHEKHLGKIHGREKVEIDKFSQTNVSAVIDPKRLEPFFGKN